MKFSCISSFFRLGSLLPVACLRGHQSLGSCRLAWERVNLVPDEWAKVRSKLTISPNPTPATVDSIKFCDKLNALEILRGINRDRAIVPEAIVSIVCNNS